MPHCSEQLCHTSQRFASRPSLGTDSVAMAASRKTSWLDAMRVPVVEIVTGSNSRRVNGVLFVFQHSTPARHRLNQFSNLL